MEIHAEIEEEIFYPAMEAVPAATKLLGEAHEEHEQVKSLVAAVQSAENAETLVSRIGELREAVLHHATEEEREMFPLAEQLGAGKLDELGQKLQERKQQLKTGLGGAAASHTRGTAQLVDALVHLAVGVGGGAVYGALVKHGRRPGLAGGAVFGLAVWAVAFGFLAPRLGITRSASEGTSQETAVNIAAHLVYGTSIALVTGELGRQTRPGETLRALRARVG